MYELFKFLHVSTAVIWVGSGVGLVALTAMMARDQTATAAVAPHLERLGGRLFGPAAGLTLVFGVITVLVSGRRGGGWEFQDLWIIIGFVGFALSGVITMLANPASKRLGPLAAERGHDHPEVAALARRVTMLHVIDIVVLFVVIADMVFKPGS